MLKYALVFVGIIKYNPSHPSSGKQASTGDKDDSKTNHDVLNDVNEFTGNNNHGLKLSVTNVGPSRSGFASSSAVAMNILKVLYYCCNMTHIANNDILLGSMALLFENHLGLKSGRQDVDGLLPNGIKLLYYKIN